MSVHTYSRHKDGRRFIPIGRITRPHGVRGAVRVAAYNPGSSLFDGSVTLFLLDSDGPPEPLRVAESGGAGRMRVVRFAGIGTVEAADALRGCELWVAASDLPPPGPDEYYLSDLPGMQAVDRDGRPLGEIGDVLVLAGRPLIELRTPDGRSVLVPSVPAHVLDVDPAGRLITLDPPKEEP